MRPLTHLLKDAASFLEGVARGTHHAQEAATYAELATAVSVAAELLLENNMGQTADRIHELKKALATAKLDADKNAGDAATLADLRANNRVLDDSDVAALGEPDVDPTPGDTGTAATGDTGTAGTVDTGTGTAATV